MYFVECEAFLNDVANDPHGWLVSALLVDGGPDIDVTCESGYSPIRGLTPQQFCSLAPHGFSYCIRELHAFIKKLFNGSLLLISCLLSSAIVVR